MIIWDGAERFCRRLNDRRPLLCELLTNHGVLVLGQSDGTGLDFSLGLELDLLLAGFGLDDPGVALGLGKGDLFISLSVGWFADGRLKALLLSLSLQFGHLGLLDDDLLVGLGVRQRAGLARPLPKPHRPRPENRPV
jgi:hypothetical protein